MIPPRRWEHVAPDGLGDVGGADYQLDRLLVGIATLTPGHGAPGPEIHLQRSSGFHGHHQLCSVIPSFLNLLARGRVSSGQLWLYTGLALLHPGQIGRIGWDALVTALVTLSGRDWDVHVATDPQTLAEPLRTALQTALAGARVTVH